MYILIAAYRYNYQHSVQYGLMSVLTAEQVKSCRYNIILAAVPTTTVCKSITV